MVQRIQANHKNEGEHIHLTKIESRLERPSFQGLKKKRNQSRTEKDSVLVGDERLELPTPSV